MDESVNESVQQEELQNKPTQQEEPGNEQGQQDGNEIAETLNRIVDEIVEKNDEAEGEGKQEETPNAPLTSGEVDDNDTLITGLKGIGTVDLKVEETPELGEVESTAETPEQGESAENQADNNESTMETEEPKSEQEKPAPAPAEDNKESMIETEEPKSEQEEPAPAPADDNKESSSGNTPDDKINKMVETGEMPPGDEQEELLAYAKRKEIDTMLSEDYAAARKYKLAEDMLTKAITEEKNRSDNFAYVNSIQGRIDALQKRIVNTQNEYDKKIGEYDILISQRRSEMEAKHQDEEKAFEEDWANPEFLAPFNRASPMLLQMRVIQKNQALSKDFDGALQTKALADQMQKGEEIESGLKAMAAMKTAYKQMIERHGNELSVAEEKWGFRRSELEEKRDKQIDADRKAIEQLELRKTQPAPKLLKTGGAVLTRPESQARRSATGATSPRTRHTLVQYRTSKPQTRLSLPGLNVRECVNPSRSATQQPFRPRTTKRYRLYNTSK